MMSNQDEFDGFTINVHLDEDGEYLAHFLERPEISAFADSPEGALRELKAAWEGVKESYRDHNEAIPIAPARKDYSGQFNVRIDKRVHRSLAIEAAQNGVSLNALVAQKLASSIAKQPQQ
jgi:predicted HicB family RNase H-like nuclease